MSSAPSTMSSAPSTNNNTSIKAKVDLRSPTRPIHVGVILLGGTTEILDIAPIDLLHGLTKESLDIFPPGSIPEEMRKQAIEIVFHYVSEKGGMAKLTSGLTVECTDTFTSCPPLDICLIGATLDNPPYTPTPGEIQYLRDTYYSPTLQSLLTICGGMVPALQAGLLEGKRATAPRMMIPMFKGMASGVKWSERRWEVDGGDGDGRAELWTSGTLLNGLDMVREWAGRVWGKDPEKDLMGHLLEFGGWPARNVEY